MEIKISFLTHLYVTQVFCQYIYICVCSNLTMLMMVDGGPLYSIMVADVDVSEILKQTKVIITLSYQRIKSTRHSISVNLVVWT